MEVLHELGVEFLLRYAHVISGITWIGLLYYFNFVQTPAFAEFEPGPRNEAVAKLVPRAMWWFRWGAAATLAFGLLLYIMGLSGDDQPFKDMKSIENLSILAGILFAVIMFTNVWMIIHPAQQKVIANAKNVLAGQEADPSIPGIARKAACASRTNTLLSIPMLFFMVATGHLFGVTSSHWNTSKGADRAIWYAIIVIVAIVVEGNALRAPAVGKPEAWYIDKHKNTIIAGVALTIVLYVLAELVFGSR